MFDMMVQSNSRTAVLDRARSNRSAADAAEAEVLATAVAWAHLHPTDDIDTAAVLIRGTESALAPAGEGAPLVAEFCVPEFAAALHLPTATGVRLIGEALELCHRLPRVWARVQAGDLQAWRARRIAGETMVLSLEAAAFVDAQVAPFAHRIGPAATERLVAEAMARFSPERAQEIADRAADGRHVTLGTNSVSFQGTTWIAGELDYADAHDLEATLSAGAAALAAAGSVESLDVRRSLALGELARGHQTLPLQSPEAGQDAGRAGSADEEVSTRSLALPARPPSREVVLHVHLAGLEDGPGIARVVTGGTRLVTTDQVRSWCQDPTARVTVTPVIDLNDHIGVDAYEVPDRLRDQVAERDITCVFPWCTRSAPGCDVDHIQPWDHGGPTATHNLGCLCRRHHRLKTHGAWSYTMLEPGTYLWRSPHGLSFLRDHTGTTEITAHPPES